MSTQQKSALIDLLGRLFMRLQDVTQNYDEAVGEVFDLNAAERHCLSFLWPGPQTASAIAREIRLTPAAVTALIDRLERRGFLVRSADPTDRRKVMVSTTAKTAELTAEAYAPLGTAGAKMLDEFSESQLAGFQQVLERSIALQEEMTARFLEQHKKG